jgi:hypothetical protein
MSTLTLTIPDSIRRRGESLAHADGITVDQFVATAVAEKIAVLDSGTYLQERAARASREKFERVLAKVPDVEPEEFDRLPPLSKPS